jgi:hypothetical protein
LLGKHKKPNLHLWAGDKAAAEKLRAFVEEHRVKVLNVAGPRASKEPGVGEFVMKILEEAFGQIAWDGSKLLEKLRTRSRRRPRPRFQQMGHWSDGVLKDRIEGKINPAALIRLTICQSADPSAVGPSKDKS